jgi:hypothetical protein
MSGYEHETCADPRMPTLLFPFIFTWHDSEA